VKRQLLTSAKAIATFTAEISAISDDQTYTKVTNGATQCAGDAKNLIAATSGTYEEFFNGCKAFGGSSLNFARVLQEFARGVQDAAHQAKVVAAYNAIKEMGPVFIRAAKLCYENNGQGNPAAELKLVSRQLAAKIGNALSVCQPDGGNAGNEVMANAPTMSLPEVDQVQALPAGDQAGARPQVRRKTIRNPDAGKEMLVRARTATIARRVNDEMDAAWAPPPAEAPPAAAPAAQAWASAPTQPTRDAGGQPARNVIGIGARAPVAQQPPAQQWQQQQQPPAPVVAAVSAAAAPPQQQQPAPPPENVARAFDTEEAESILVDYERDMGSVSAALGDDFAPAPAGASNDADKARIAELEAQLTAANARIESLVDETEALQLENEQLLTLTDSMRKRLAAKK
jgi:hypothetical protein